MISVWFFIALIYLTGVIYTGIYFCYKLSHKGMSWLDEVQIGAISLFWPVLPLAFLVARLARILSTHIIDKIIIKLGATETEKEQR